MLKHKDITFRYDPYPVGLTRNVLAPDTYEKMVQNFPTIDMFNSNPVHGNKFSLSEKSNPKEYHRFVERKKIWRKFHHYIKKGPFIEETIEFLRRNYLDLGLSGKFTRSDNRWKAAWEMLTKGRHQKPYLTARFEFSILPADGGAVRVHTDTPSKIITMIVSMMKPGEWDPAYGGGTVINRPKDITKNFNFLNAWGEYEDYDTLDVLPFDPNQCVTFIKTFNSFHSVVPMTAKGSNLMRKTLTLGIERIR